MELKTKNEEQKPVSVLQGDGLCISRILARESSVGQSSHMFYRAAEGIPFRWEMQPGRPKNPQEEEAIPPPSPSPLMQSLGLPLPNLDHDEPKEWAFKTSKILWLRKMVKKRINSDIIKKVEVLGRRRKQESSRFGDSNAEFVTSFKDSSFSSNYSSSLFSPSIRVLDSSMIDGPFVAVRGTLLKFWFEEGNTKIYYCSHHKTAFAVEEDGSFLSRILSRVSAADQFSGPLYTDITQAGIPFRWEMQPGTPKNPPENELIPPPSPPPALQSLSLPQPRVHADGEKAKKSTWKRAWFWIRCYVKKKETGKMQHEISFRYDEKMEIFSSDEELDASFCETGSVSSLSSVAPLSKGNWRVSKIRRNFQGSYLSCGPWSRRDILVFARRKLKSFTS